MNTYKLSRIVLVLLTIHSVEYGGAQSLEIGQKWIYDQWIWDDPKEYTTSLEIINDTIIDGLKYFVIEGQCICSDESNRYIREEGDYYFTYHNGEHLILYDWTLEEGDIRTLPATFGYGQDSIKIMVDSVGTLFFNGKAYHVQYVSSQLHYYESKYYSDWGGVFIRGIGSSWCLFPQYPLCENQTAGLRCVTYEDDEVIIINPNKNCINVGTSSQLSISLNVFPNPTYGLVEISTDGIIDQIQLVDLHGVIHRINPFNQVFIAHPPGIYFIRVLIDGVWYEEKVIKLSR